LQHTPELLHHPYLQSFGLVINTILKCICCQQCMIAIPPSHVQGHLTGAHPGGKMKVDVQKLNALVEDGVLIKDLPTLRYEHPVEPFAGLQVHPGLRCVHCPKVTGNQATMIKHHHAEHGKDHSTPKTWPACHMQRLTSAGGKHRGYWQVESPQAHEVSIDSMVEQLQVKAMDTIKVDMTAVNARSISPWLLATGWHTHIQGYETKELLSLISIPKEDEFPGLKNLVRTYMLKATDLMDSTDDLCLQHLNTADPAKT
jgi:hypothetical protein